MRHTLRIRDSRSSGTRNRSCCSSCLGSYACSRKRRRTVGCGGGRCTSILAVVTQTSIIFLSFFAEPCSRQDRVQPQAQATTTTPDALDLKILDDSSSARAASGRDSGPEDFLASTAAEERQQQHHQQHQQQRRHIHPRNKREACYAQHSAQSADTGQDTDDDDDDDYVDLLFDSGEYVGTADDDMLSWEECPSFDWIDVDFRESSTVDSERARRAAQQREAGWYWNEVVKVGATALRRADVRPSTRAVFDALDAFGRVIRCCPGALAGPYPYRGDHHDPRAGEDDNGVGDSDQNDSRSCGLLEFIDNNSDDGDSAGESGVEMGQKNSSRPSLTEPMYFGLDITFHFSRALRLARLPSYAQSVLHDAVGFEMNSGRRAKWGIEMAMVLLQQGETMEAIMHLKNALAVDKRDLTALQLLGASLVARGFVAEGFHYLREAADVQRSVVDWMTSKIVEEEGLDPALRQADTIEQEETIETGRDWMVMFLGWTLEGRLKDLGASSPVLRQVENFLDRHFSVDSEMSFMLGRELAKAGFDKEAWDYLSSAAAPWNRQIYRVRAVLSIPAVANSRDDLALAMVSLERGIAELQPTHGWKASSGPGQGTGPGVVADGGGLDSSVFERGESRGGERGGSFPHDTSRNAVNGDERPIDERGAKAPKTAATTGFMSSLSACSFGGLNYPDVAFDHIPLLPFTDYYRPKYTQRPRGMAREPLDSSPEETVQGSGGSGEEGGQGGNRGQGRQDGSSAVSISLHADLGRLFLRLCPDLGDFVAPQMAVASEERGPESRQDFAPPGVGGIGRRVRVAFVSSGFGNQGTTKRVAGLMRRLPRKWFEVIIASWPTLVDPWMREHVLPLTEIRPVNLVQNRTVSLERLAKRRPDVVVFADASMDRKSYLLAFGRIAPVQIAMWGHAPTLGIPSVDYYVVPESLAAKAWAGNGNLDSDTQCPADVDDGFTGGTDFADVLWDGVEREGSSRAKNVGDRRRPSEGRGNVVDYDEEAVLLDNSEDLLLERESSLERKLGSEVYLNSEERSPRGLEDISSLFQRGAVGDADAALVGGETGWETWCEEADIDENECLMNFEEVFWNDDARNFQGLSGDDSHHGQFGRGGDAGQTFPEECLACDTGNFEESSAGGRRKSSEIFEGNAEGDVEMSEDLQRFFSDFAEFAKTGRHPVRKEGYENDDEEEDGCEEYSLDDDDDGQQDGQTDRDALPVSMIKHRRGDGSRTVDGSSGMIRGNSRKSEDDMDDSEENEPASGDEDKGNTNENAKAEGSASALYRNNAMVSGGSQSNTENKEGAAYLKEFEEYLASAEECEHGELSIGLDLNSREDRRGEGGRRHAPTAYDTASGGTPEGPMEQSDSPKYRETRFKLNLVEDANEGYSKFRAFWCEDSEFCQDPDYGEFEDINEDRDVEEDEDEGDDGDMAEEYYDDHDDDHDDDDDDDIRDDWFFDGLVENEQEWSELALESALESGSEWGGSPSASADGFNVDDNNGDVDYESPPDELGARRSGIRELLDVQDEGQEWPKPFADVSYGSTVEEQVVLLGGFGPFVEPPGRTTGGPKGRGRGKGREGEAGERARDDTGEKVRRRHFLPASARLAVLPIPVYHVHTDFDVAMVMLLDRHPLIHVIIAVEEIHGEAVGTEREFDRYDVLQHASAPVWTEKLRKRLARRLGDNIWRLHLLPPLDSRDYFSLLGAADVVLDPFPVGNLHPAVDALALGTPVVTLPARQRAGARYVQALLTDLGVPPSCCGVVDVKNYVDMAARFCLDEVWSAEVSDLLDYVKHWVYLHPDTPRSSSASLSPSGQPSGDFDQSKTQSGRMDQSTEMCGSSVYENERRESPWAEEHRHVAEWAEFLWRVARPGVDPHSFVDAQAADYGGL